MFKKIPLNQFSKQFRINSSIYFHLNPVFKQVLVAHACNLRMLRQEDCNLQACLGDTIRHRPAAPQPPEWRHQSLQRQRAREPLAPRWKVTRPAYREKAPDFSIVGLVYNRNFMKGPRSTPGTENTLEYSCYDTTHLALAGHGDWGRTWPEFATPQTGLPCAVHECT